jgi:hypothetical protein
VMNSLLARFRDVAQRALLGFVWLWYRHDPKRKY